MTVEEIKDEKERLYKRLNDLDETMMLAVKNELKDSGIPTQLEAMGFKVIDENTWEKKLNDRLNRFDLTVQWNEHDGSYYLTLIDSYGELDYDVECTSETLMEEIMKFKLNVYKQTFTFTMDGYTVEGQTSSIVWSQKDMINAVIYARECGDITEAKVNLELVNTLEVN